MLSRLETFPYDLMRLTPFGCDPMNGGTGGGGGGETVVDLTGAAAAAGEAGPLVMAAGVFLAAGIWSFRKWGRPTTVAAAESATPAICEPSAV